MIKCVLLEFNSIKKYIEFLSCSRHNSGHFREDENGEDFLCEGNTGEREIHKVLQ